MDVIRLVFASYLIMTIIVLIKLLCVIRLVFASYLIMTIIVMINLLIIYLCVLLGWCLPRTS